MPLIQPNTFGGLFKARSGQGLDLDRQIILGLGFTIIGQDLKAGETEVFVHGPESSVDTVTNDFELKVQLPSWFFRLPVGEELTESLIRDWTDRSNLFFA